MGTLIKKFVLLLLIAFPTWAQKPPVAPAITPNQKDNDSTRVTKEAAAEAMISQTEERALETLENILKRQKGSPNEPDLWLRRGELYMRRAKSARFFEFQREDLGRAGSLVPEVIKNQQSRKHLVDANRSYLKVFNEFKNHPRADQALYTFSFNLEQLGEPDKAIIYYSQLINQYPKSLLLPDSLLATGEIYFQKTQFDKALDYFGRLQAFPNSRAYWYAEYKKGWVYYNLKDNDKAMAQLILVITKAPSDGARLSLREEALKDSTLFFSEANSSKEAYTFYSKLIKDEDELIPILVRLSDLYVRHSRYQDARHIYEDILKKHRSDKVKVQVHVKQANTEILDKSYISSSHSLALAVAACEKIKGQASQCEIDLPETQTKLIRLMWADFKKKPQDENSKKELEKQILQAQKSASTPESVNKFTSLLGDFYFQDKRYEKSAKAYFESYKVKPSEKTLLAAIDSMTLASEQNKRLTDTRVQYIDTYLKDFPIGEQATSLQIKKVAIFLSDKEPQKAKLDIEALLAKSEKLSATDRVLVEDLHFDYLNQNQNYALLLLETQKAAAKTKNSDRKHALTKMSDEITIKVAEGQLSKISDVKQKKDVIQSLGKVAIESNTLDSKSKKAAFLLAIQESYKNKFYLLTLDLSKKFVTDYSNENETQTILKNTLKLSLDLGDLKSALDISKRLLLQSKGRERSQLVKTILELQQVIGSQAELRQFADKHLQDLSTEDRAELFSYLWKSSMETGDTDSQKWSEQKISQFSIEPLYSEIQLRHIDHLISTRKYEEAFQRSRHYMGPSNPREIRAQARLQQARIFEKELGDISTKTRLERLHMVLAVKTERLEKAQKAYSDVISMSSSKSPIHVEAHLGLERTLADYLKYIEDLQIRSSVPADQLSEIKASLQQLSSPIAKKLEKVRESLTDLRQNTSEGGQLALAVTSFNWDVQLIHQSVAPIIDDSIASIYPAFILNSTGTGVRRYQAPGSCRAGSSDLGDIQNCLSTAKNEAEVVNALKKLDSHILPDGLIAYLRSFEALKNKRNKEALYLLQVAQAQNPKEQLFKYQNGRALLQSGQLATGLEQLNQAYLNGMDLKVLQTVSIIDGYLQGNCYRSLAFADAAAESRESKNLLAPVMSECFARTHDTSKALQALKSTSSSQFSHALQAARVHEDYLEDPATASQWYGRAAGLTTNAQAKVWLSKKIEHLKSQVSGKKADNRMSMDRGTN